MKKAEAEKAIRSLYSQWRRLPEYQDVADSSLSFGEFWRWLKANSPGHLEFRSSTSVQYDVELWFDQESKQAWMR